MVSYLRVWLAALIAPPGWQLLPSSLAGHAEAASSLGGQAQAAAEDRKLPDKQPAIFIG